MLDTFKAQLKAKAKTLGAANLSNKRIDAYAATLEETNPDLATDDDHKEKVEAFTKLVNLKEIAAYDDWQVSKSKKDTKQDSKTDDKKDDGKTDSTQTPDDTPAWAKTILETNKAMADRLQALESEKHQSTIKTKLAAELKDVPEKFWGKRALPTKDEEIEAFVTEAKTDYTDFEQTRVNDGLSRTSRPNVPSTGAKDKADPSVVAFAQKQNATVKQPAATSK